VLSALRSAVPLALRETSDGLQVVASAFGPLVGDRTRLELVVEEGARLEVGAVASQVGPPGSHDAVSHAGVDLQVGAAGLAELGSTAARRDGRRRAPDGAVRKGRPRRHDGAGRDRRARAAGPAVRQAPLALAGDVRRPPVLAADLDVGPGAAAGWDGPAVSGGARVLVTALLVGPDLPVGLLVEGAQVLSLAGPGLLLTWVGSDTVEAAAVVTAFLAGVLAPAPA